MKNELSGLQLGPEHPCNGVRMPTIQNKCGMGIAYVASTEEAQQLVHCCNLHPELIALAEHIQAMSDDAYLTGHPEWPEIVNQSRAVLAKAKGE